MITMSSFKTLFVPSMLSVAAIACGGEVQGNGVATTETRALAGFDRVRVRQEVGARVTIDSSKSAAQTEVKLSGDANLLPIISTIVDHGELVIDLVGDSRGIDSAVGVMIEASVPVLLRADLEHGASLDVAGIDASAFSLSAIGGSTADLAGRATLLDIEMAGGSVARLTHLQAHEAHLQIAGAAEVDLCVKHRLEGEAAGNSKVQYTCNPSEVDVDTAGGSTISRL